MTILNIHGFRGHGNNSAFKALSFSDADIIAPDIDYETETPDAVIAMLQKIIDEKHVDIMIGTSYGGFFASILSARNSLRAVLINPCMLPFVQLARLGYEGDIKKFIPLFEEAFSADESKLDIIIGEDDEVIDTHDVTMKMFRNARFKTVPSGKHSGETLPLESYFKSII